MGKGGSIQSVTPQLGAQSAFGNPYVSRGLPMQTESSSPTGLSAIFSGNSEIASSSNSLNSMPITGGSGGSGGSGGPFPLEGRYGIIKMANGGLAGAAQNMADQGRDGDSMLVHMSPGEVKGLQALAMAHGGSLSINPDTGLVEASFLKRILPMIAGAGLSMIPGVGPFMAAGMVGGVETLRTGDIGKGLMAGLGAYGGAGLAGSLSNAAASTAVDASAQNLANQAVAEGSTTAGMAEATRNTATPTLSSIGEGAKTLYNTPGGMTAFAKDNLMNIGAAAAPVLGDAMTPKGPPIPGQPEEDPRYAGSPYRYNLSPGFQGSTPTRPNPYYRPTGLGYAEGGDVKKKEEKPVSASQPNLGSLGAYIASVNEPKGPKYFGESFSDYVGRKDPTGGRGDFGNMIGYVVDSLHNPQSAAASVAGGTSGGVPEGYVMDRRTGQLVPASSYSPQGLGYTGYAEGGVMMADGGSYTDEPMGDNPGMAAGGIAGYAAGGLKMKTMGLGDGIYRDTDDDTASLGAYDAAKKRMEKQFAAANLKPREMPKSGIAKLGQMKAMAEGGLGGYSDGGRMLKGPGDGMSDDIPAMIGRKQPARLADGEFVVPADVVSHLGNGSTDAGAKKLYSMMDKIRTARTGKKKQAPAVKASKYMPA
jgi:hypothetical protein